MPPHPLSPQLLSKTPLTGYIFSSERSELMIRDSTLFRIDPQDRCSLSKEERERYRQVRERLMTLGWYDAVQLPEDPPEIPSRYRFLRLPGDCSTLIYNLDWGQQGVLHHFERPDLKAREWWTPRRTLDPEVRCIFHGLGLGYSIPNLIEQADAGVRTLVVERDLSTFSLCMALSDLEKLVSHPNIEVRLVSDAVTAAARTLDWLRKQRKSRLRFIMDPAGMFPHPVFVRDWLFELSRILPQFAEPCAREIRNNYPHSANLAPNWGILQTRPGIRHLFGRFENVPMVVVGAGPCLDEILPLLKSCRDKVMILACDTAARPLLNAGIPIDMVVAIDSSPENYSHLEGLEDVSFLPVLYGGVDPRLLQAFRNKAWIAGTAPFPTAELLECPVGPSGYLRRKGCLVINGSVSSSVLDLALKLGGDPVFLAGVDLAYCGGKDHATGTRYEKTNAFRDRQPALFKVPSVRGEEVPTCSPFLVSLLGIAYQVELSGRRIYNLSSHGALIPGTLAREEGLETLQRIAASRTGDSARGKLVQSAGACVRELVSPIEWRSPDEKDMDFCVDPSGRLRTEPTPENRVRTAQANLEALKRKDPESARKLDESLHVLETGRLGRGEVCEWRMGRESYPRILVRDVEGRLAASLPTGDQPWFELREWQAGKSAESASLIVVLGIGLGHHVRDLLSHLKDGVIWLWEPYPDRLRISLAVSDFRDIFSEPRFHICLEREIHGFFRKMFQHHAERIYQQPVSWRPWPVPGYGAWLREEEHHFIEFWLRLFPDIHPRPEKIQVKPLQVPDPFKEKMGP